MSYALRPQHKPNPNVNAARIVAESESFLRLLE